MKDWIKSPEPEDPDEVLARHRRYEEEEAQDEQRRRNEASTSRLQDAVKAPTTAARTVLVGKRRRRSGSSAGSSRDATSPPAATRAPINRNVRQRVALSDSSSAAAAATLVKTEPSSDNDDDDELLPSTLPALNEGDAALIPRPPQGDATGEDYDDPTRPIPLRPRRIKTARLMSLADMSFRTVLTHLPSLDSTEIRSIIQPCLPTLSHRFSSALAQACDSHLDHLARSGRAKEAARKAREEEKNARRTSVALDSAGAGGVRRRGVAGGGGAFVVGRPKVQKSQGGKKIWQRAKMAAGVRR